MMNRPNKEDYTFLCEHTVATKLSRYYVLDLEAYCDELEKALDNACDMLETYDLANNELTRKKRSQKEWKEWCLKNE